MAQHLKQLNGLNTPEPDQESVSPSHRFDKSPSHEDKDEQIIQLQRKLKALKDAFIKEREVKKEIEKELAEHKRKLSTYEVSLIDKENQISRLQSENTELNDQIMSLRKRVETSTSGSEGENNLGSLGSTLSSSIVEMFGGKKGGADEFKQLQAEYNYLKKQFDAIKERLMTIDEEKTTMQHELTNEVERLRAVCATAEANYARAADELVKKAQDAAKFEKMFTTISQAHSALKEQFAAQSKEFQELKSKHEAIMKEKDHYKASFEEISKDLEEKNHILEQLESQTRILSEKKLALDQIMQEKEIYIKDIEEKCQVFSLTRKGAQDVPALMILRKDAEGDYVVDIETPENRKLLLPCQITSISPNKENKSLFTLTYRVTPNKSEEETFETPDTIQLLKTIKKFMVNAKEKTKNAQQVSSLKKDSGQKKDKGLIAEVVSFFAS